MGKPRAREGDRVRPFNGSPREDIGTVLCTKPHGHKGYFLVEWDFNGDIELERGDELIVVMEDANVETLFGIEPN